MNGHFICLLTERGYWTGFTFVKSHDDKRVKFYRTEVGAMRASDWLSKRYRMPFNICIVQKSNRSCPICGNKHYG